MSEQWIYLVAIFPPSFLSTPVFLEIEKGGVKKGRGKEKYPQICFTAHEANLSVGGEWELKLKSYVQGNMNAQLGMPTTSPLNLLSNT